jgi:hypothetical protein
MKELDAYLAVPGAPTPRALLEQVLNGTAPPLYRSARGFFVDEDGSTRPIDPKPLRAISRFSPDAPRPTEAEIETLFAAAMVEMRAGLARTPFED